MQIQKLAEVDWNNDGRDDWILLCRVDNPIANDQRDYYLVIENVDAPTLIPQIMAVYDCRNKYCTLFMEAGTNPTSKVDPEVQVLEGMPGQRSVVPPPNSPAPEGTPKPGITEHKLGG